MKAMRLHRPGQPLRLDDIDIPSPDPDEVRIKIAACGVCRTDLHVIDGDLPPHVLPLIPGHEVVGHVVEIGSDVDELKVGMRVGVPWLARTCGQCVYCRSGRENLCDRPKFTGYDTDGGYAEYMVASAANCIVLDSPMDDVHLAPMLCAGLIGFRSYKRAGKVERLGLVGFGAAAHIIAQVAKADGVEVYAFTRPGDIGTQRFALSLGVAWAGGTDAIPPQPLDAAIIFAASGDLVPWALRQVRKGGRVVCAGIHMSDIPQFPYADLWGEREVVSVANLTRQDGTEFFRRLHDLRIETTVRPYPLAQANQALDDLRHGDLHGAAVLVP